MKRRPTAKMEEFLRGDEPSPSPSASPQKKPVSHRTSKRDVARMRQYNISKSQQQIEAEKKYAIQMFESAYYVKDIVDKRHVEDGNKRYTEIRMAWGDSWVPLTCAEMNVEDINCHLRNNGIELLTKEEEKEVLGRRKYTKKELENLNYASIDPNEE